MKISNEKELEIAKVEVEYKRRQEERIIVLTIHEIGEMLNPTSIAKKFYRKLVATPEFKKIMVPIAIAAGAGMALAQTKQKENPGEKIKDIVTDVVDGVIDNYEIKIRAITLAILKNILPGSVEVKNEPESFTNISV